LHNFTELVQMIQKIAIRTFEASNPSRSLFGTVTKEDPLEISVEQKLPLTMKQLILSRNVTDYKTKISFDDPNIKNVITTSIYPSDANESIKSYQRFKENIKNDITIYNGLKVGEEVILIQMQDGQKYIVWDRVIK